ncbi:MAG: magnesium transporter [Tissierellia bacterium]|nr:magnesium transporter [Tissierellia bacterium]
MRLEDVLELLGERNYVKLSRELSDINAIDISELMEELSARDSLIVFRLLGKDLAAEVFTELDSDRQMQIVESSTDQQVSRIINEMYMDDMVDFIEEMPANAVKKILRNTTAENRELINQILHYPEKSAGTIMTTEYVVLKQYFTVQQALDYINKNGVDKVTVYICYVTDAERKLLGFVSLRQILTAELDQRISEIMDDDVVYVKTLDDQEYVSEVFIKYGYTAIPVVDEERRMVGIITVDDIIDVIQEEDTEDFHRMAGLTPSEEPYLSTSFFKLAKNRIGWLLILMITATISGGIIDNFSEVLTSVVVLNAFIPMLMGTGGNSGNQSSTLIIRGMATGEIEHSDWKRVLRKELVVSIIVGTILAVVNFFRLILLDKVSPAISFVVSITMMMTVMSAMVIGGLLPIAAAKFKLDPAIMAAPLITTIVDASCLIIYFNIASAVLGL